MNARQVKPGDVVLVVQQVTPKDKQQKPYTWRWFGVVVEVARRSASWAMVYRLGADKRAIMQVHPGSHGCEVTVLPEDQWPDGVWALRTQAMLAGEIEI